MAAPDYVPLPPGRKKYYESPPRRPASWLAERPGEIESTQAHLPGGGYPGPDQGYALRLVRLFEDHVHLERGERWAEVAAGAVVVALKRASIFGRAPVKHDLEIALGYFGYLDDAPDPELVAIRRAAFDHVDSPHHYLEARRIAASVPEEALRRTPQQAHQGYAADWRRAVDVDVLTDGVHGEAVSID